ncbi:MAG: DUF1476 domain-containing protein [Rickettsiales bacterium]|nr:DUF1476 domain-containing protein [Rickettsiales bacterium]
MSIDNRKKGQESKYALDKEQEFKAMARRNKLLGLWAAGELNYDDAKAADYAKEVVMADFEEPGDEDVFRKVHQDFQAAGLEREDDIRAKMVELLGVASEQIISEE